MKKIINFFNNLGDNIKSSVIKTKRFTVSAFGELQNVEWLSKRETIKFSVYVILFIIITTGIITLLDIVFYRGLIFIIN